MANPTTNYGFVLPTPTDLVTDLPADFEVALQGVDTQMKTNADAAIAKTIVDAKGDLIAATASDTVSRLAVGANDQVLTADSTTATGLKWATAGGGANWTLLNAGGTALTGAQTITISGISGKDKIMVLVDKGSSLSNGSNIGIRLNTDTGSNYYRYGQENWSDATWNSNNFYRTEGVRTIITLCQNNVSGNDVSGYVLLSGCASSGVKVFNSIGAINSDAGNGGRAYATGGYYNSATAISSVSINSSVGNFRDGTIFVYTSA